MLAYNYTDNGEYFGSENLQPNPLESGKWLVPANSTLIAPPDFNSENQVCRFMGDVWEVINIPEPIVEQEPEPTEAELNDLKIQQLKSQLAAEDYKIVKCMEYQVAGLVVPYDIVELHTKREEIRAMINQAEQGL